MAGEVDGYIYLGQQTPAFYAKQVVASLVDYGMSLLPPFFGGLMAYDAEANDRRSPAPGTRAGSSTASRRPASSSSSTSASRSSATTSATPTSSSATC